ncbi:unnamed protein product [Orchesella dallaii]|uniref:Uncharacterized protein n=1 Tax=Orchesella dallaii TaxID=48710 RepID=A0ABP1R189_9HEXA
MYGNEPNTLNDGAGRYLDNPSHAVKISSELLSILKSYCSILLDDHEWQASELVIIYYVEADTNALTTPTDRFSGIGSNTLTMEERHSTNDGRGHEHRYFT